MAMLAGLRLVESDKITETKTSMKRWRRLNRPDKVRVRCKVVPGPVYRMGDKLLVHPAVARRLQAQLPKLEWWDMRAKWGEPGLPSPDNRFAHYCTT